MKPLFFFRITGTFFRKGLLLILSFGISVILQADPSALFRDAGDLYKSGKYAEALAMYDSINKMGLESADLYFNIGNSWFKLHNVPRAILYYERASRLNPGDEEINYNLELARSMVVDKLEKMPEFFLTDVVKNLIHSRSSNSWALLGIYSFILFLLLLIIFLFSLNFNLRKTVLPFAFFLLVLVFFSVYSSVQQKDSVENRSTAIVMTPSVTLKSSPDIGGTDIFILHEGTKVIVEDRLGDWVEIRISDGNKGWIKSADIERI